MSKLPRTSMWGVIKKLEYMRDGVFMVNAENGGGVMVRKRASKFLSPEARKIGINAGNYICFPKEKGETVVLRELLDKKLWEIPVWLSNRRIPDKEAFETYLNDVLIREFPEYWEARQTAVAKQAEQDVIPDVRLDIIFYGTDYKERFRVKDGESIKITDGFDGKEYIKKCRYLDEHHFTLGGETYHVDEFMRRQTQAGNTYEPIPSQEPKIDIVVSEPGKPPYYSEIPINMAALRDVIGGQPEIMHSEHGAIVLRGINGNGALAVCGFKNEHITNLHPYKAQNYKNTINDYQSAFARKKPSTLAERLEAGKAKAAAQDATRQPSDTPQKKKNAAEH
ncbi:MAG: hypothetical protein FWD58_10675 [Firmicutes bacterium]|nr:hypothetical protein [Bacillota bacterium]